jgi:hypothetical protein
VQIGIRVELQPFLFFVGRLSSADLEPVLRAEGETYLHFMRERYVTMSAGQWAPLSEVTNKEREWLGFPPVAPILIRDGTLGNALIPGNPGNVFEVNGDTARVGIGGPAIHPGYPPKKPNSSQATIGEIAAAHQYGAGLPVREILVAPDQSQLNAMRVDAQLAWNQILAQTIVSAA